MPRLLKKTEVVAIPEGVEITINRKTVNVKGKLGELTKTFDHPKVDIYIDTVAIKKGHPKVRCVVVDMWYGNRRDAAVVRTICTRIKNMFLGVTKGYSYKMRVVYAHFPVTLVVAQDGSSVQIQNFVGQKKVSHIDMWEGVKVASTGKDEITLTGCDVEAVSQCAANIHQADPIHDKDLRQFLDGVYVSEKGLAEE